MEINVGKVNFSTICLLCQSQFAAKCIIVTSFRYLYNREIVRPTLRAENGRGRPQVRVQVRPVLEVVHRQRVVHVDVGRVR